MDWDTVLSVLKWIGLAFAAGLVGYFGKHLGKVIIARFSKSGSRPSPMMDPEEEPGRGTVRAQPPAKKENEMAPVEESAVEAYEQKKPEPAPVERKVSEPLRGAQVEEAPDPARIEKKEKPPDKADKERDKEAYKLEKKHLKAEKKQAKKQGKN